MENKRKIWMQRRRRVSEIVEAGTAEDPASRAYDIFSTMMTLTNIAVTVLYTFDRMEWNHGSALLMIESITVAFLPLNICFESGPPDSVILPPQNGVPLRNM